MKNGQTPLAGRLNKRVTFLRPRGPDDPPPDTDEYGQPVDNPIEVCTVWAEIDPLRGRELYAAMRENAEVTTRIRIRYREGIDRTMTVRFGTDTFFEILYPINPKFANRELHLMCKERL